MADRELEINNYKEKVEWLENTVAQLKKELIQNEVCYTEEIKKISSQTPNESKPHIVQKEEQFSVNSESPKTECSLVSFNCFSKHLVR